MKFNKKGEGTNWVVVGLITAAIVLLLSSGALANGWNKFFDRVDDVDKCESLSSDLDDQIGACVPQGVDCESEYPQFPYTIENHKQCKKDFDGRTQCCRAQPIG